MWARFSERFLFDRRPRQAIAFDVPPGIHNKPRDVVEAAIAAGKAAAVKAPSRKDKQSNTPAAESGHFFARKVENGGSRH